jgi:hypothetical protein
VQRVYCDGDEKDEKDGGVAIRKNLTAQYKKATKEFERMRESKELRAGDFKIRDPKNNPAPTAKLIAFLKESGTEITLNSLIDMLDISLDTLTENTLSASVRDTTESLEVVIIQKRRDGLLHLLPWVKYDDGNGEIAKNDVPCDELAKKILQCSVNLPYTLSNPGMISYAVTAIEQQMIDLALFDCWQNSHFLKGKLAIVVNENFETTLRVKRGDAFLNYDIKYSKSVGLEVEKHEKEANE